MIRRLVLSSRDPFDALPRDGDLALLRREFPTVGIEASYLPLGARARRGRGARIVDLEEWRRPDADLAALDARIASCAGTDAIHLVTAPGPIEDAAIQVLTRYQGWVDRRNEASASPLFDRVLGACIEDEPHRERVRAPWQWVLRLAPGAGLALQLAALFRRDTFTEPAPSDAEDLARARAALRLRLARLAVPTPVGHRVVALALGGDAPSGDADRAVLDDAVALSFFSRSDAVLRDEGITGTRAAVRHALHRLRPAARPRLFQVRLVPAVWQIVEDVLRAEP